ncbi:MULTISPECIES: GNAT family N-acetyltransferase [unclassified Kribbella]|uniref:GNAT family N-acetyltransferase n=1 Tax=unclassified Kribbella TaxID=2644121 RepID=UPI003019CC9C
MACVDVYLETERLVLRRFTASDVDLLAELYSDPEVMRFLTGRATPREEIESYVLPAILRRYDEYPGLGTLAAEQRTGGVFVGWFGLQPTSVPTTVDVGYRLNRTAWGKGYATEGTRALTDKAFGELGMQRVVADTMAVNHRSRAVMRRSGLRFVRIFHQHFDDPLPGTEFGEVEYAVDRRTWEAGRRA